MLLVQLACERCHSYSRFVEEGTVEVPYMTMSWDSGIEYGTADVPYHFLRCLICGEVSEDCYDDFAWEWLYWYAWWNGEEPDGATHIDDEDEDDEDWD